VGINSPLTQNLMPNKTFFWFFLPTGLAMILFIGLPINRIIAKPVGKKNQKKVYGKVSVLYSITE